MESNREIYRQICAAHPEIPLFLQAWWLDAACQNEWAAIFSLNPDGSVRGAFTYFLRRRFGMKAILPPMLTPYQGPWFFYPDGMDDISHSAFDSEVCSDLLSQLEALGAGLYEQSINFRLQNVANVIGNGYATKERFTYRLDPIPPLDVIIDGFPDRKRRLLRSKEYKSLKVSVGLDAETFYNAYKSELEEKGSKIFYSFEYFKRLYDAAKSHNAGEIISLSDPDGNIHSALWIVWDADSAYTEVLYINSRFRNSGASIGVIIEAIKFLEGKCKALDFAGSMIPAVAERNRMFGALPVSYFTLSKITNPLLRVWRALKR